ncbi:MAG: biotin/lipoyl-binding protein [Bacteroidales bacterium]|nr:biotin/lipoyl-binding protein [Bacteroidales bacterium]
MNKFKFTIRGNNYDVHIQKMEDNVVTLDVNGSVYEVEVHEQKKQSKTPILVRKPLPIEVKEVEKKERGTSTPVLAPLPGTIIQLMTKEGDIVKKGQCLMTMEAMKMENNVLAEREGVVEKIFVKPGDSVLQGDKLVDMV